MEPARLQREGGAASGGPRLSVVVPIYNEEGALPGLLEELRTACEGIGGDYEIVLVDDGSTDGTRDLVWRWAEADDRIRPLQFRRNFGKSAALDAGFEHTRGELVVTIDGDGQDDPAEIPAMIERLEEGFDVVSGWKRDRQDPPGKRWPSGWFNFVTRRASSLDLHDFNSGFKLYRGECARSLDVYGELHRYLPVLAAQQGWRVTELPVRHRAREHGASKFGPERYVRGMLDLMTVSFMGRYGTRPLHLFGGVGLLLGLSGFLISLYMAILRLSGESIGSRPLLLLGILLIVVGAQFLTLGLLGQMVIADRQRARPYLAQDAPRSRERSRPRPSASGGGAAGHEPGERDPQVLNR